MIKYTIKQNRSAYRRKHTATLKFQEYPDEWKFDQSICTGLYCTSIANEDMSISFPWNDEFINMFNDFSDDERYMAMREIYIKNKSKIFDMFPKHDQRYPKVILPGFNDEGHGVVYSFDTSCHTFDECISRLEKVIKDKISLFAFICSQLDEKHLNTNTLETAVAD